MQAPILFLIRSVCRSVVAKGLDGLLGNGSLSDCIREISSDALDRYRRDVPLEVDRVAEISSIVQMPIDQVRVSAGRAYDSIRDAATPDIRQIMDRTIVREKVLLYLELIPCIVRSLFRRPADPLGHTPPSGFSLSEPIDVARILPNRLVRFKYGDRPIENVTLLDLLSLGEHGEVWKGERSTPAGSTPVAVHFLTFPEASRFMINEGELLKRAMEVSGSIPGFVRIQQINKESDPPCVEYEFVHGGDLCGLINEMSNMPRDRRPAMAIQIFLRLSRTIAPLHTMVPPFVHRDLKPANIFLVRKIDSKFDLKVGDLGIGGLSFLRSTDQPGNRRANPFEVISQSLRGSYTQTYASPEQRVGAAPHTTDDVHALGVIGLQLLLGDLRRGPVGDWDQELADNGIGQNIIDVLRQCFLSKPHRFPHAGVLSSALEKLLADINSLEKNMIAGTATLNPPPITKSTPKPNATSANVPAIPDSVAIPEMQSRASTQSQTDTSKSISTNATEHSPSSTIMPPPVSKNIPPHVPPSETITKPKKAFKTISPILSGIIVTATVLIATSYFSLVYLLSNQNSDASSAKMNSGTINSKSDMTMSRFNEKSGTDIANLNNTDNDSSPGKMTYHQIGDTIELPLSESSKMKFAWVPPGQSWLGGGDGKEGEIPFTLEKGLWCGVYEVTQKEWLPVMGSNPSDFSGKQNLPVENVSYNNVIEFLEKINVRSKNSGYIFRLPSASEWEYILRGGPIAKNQSRYNFYFAYSKTDLVMVPSDELSSMEANFDGNYPYPAVGGKKGPNLKHTSTVGSYLSNPLGMYDMHGNVWEWTSTNEDSAQVYCGGGWSSLGGICLASNRSRDAPFFSSYSLGFRLLAVPVKAESSPMNFREGQQSPIRDKALAHKPIIGDVRQIKVMDTLSIPFAWVPPGQSWLGGGDGKEGETPFTLDKGLWCGIYEVKQEEWQAVMGNNPSYFKDKPNLPVEQVSYNNAIEFIENLNNRSKKSGYLFRLPSEKEWEYILRGGPIPKVQSRYNFYFASSKTDLTAVATNDLSSTQANFDGNYPDGGGKIGPCLEQTSTVGNYLPNPLGIYDMHGNVWEWTSTEKGAARLYCGGSWLNVGGTCKSSNRFRDVPIFRNSLLGFRLLAVPVEE